MSATVQGSKYANAITASPAFLGMVLGNTDRAAPEPASQGHRRQMTAGSKCITPLAIMDCPLSQARLSESC